LQSECAGPAARAGNFIAPSTGAGILTVSRLGLPAELRRSFACTNIIENMMGTVRRVTRNVKRWSSPSMALRWTAAAMDEAKKGFRRLKAFRQLPALRAALAAHYEKRKGNKQPRCCSKREGRLTSFTAALASQSSTARGAIPGIKRQSREAAQQRRNEKFTALFHHLSVDQYLPGMALPKSVSGAEQHELTITVSNLAAAQPADFGLLSAFFWGGQRSHTLADRRGSASSGMQSRRMTTSRGPHLQITWRSSTLTTSTFRPW
jgi:hypothetical protein